MNAAELRKIANDIDAVERHLRPLFDDVSAVFTFGLGTSGVSVHGEIERDGKDLVLLGWYDESLKAVEWEYWVDERGREVDSEVDHPVKPKSTTPIPAETIQLVDPQEILDEIDDREINNEYGYQSEASRAFLEARQLLALADPRYGECDPRFEWALYQWRHDGRRGVKVLGHFREGTRDLMFTATLPDGSTAEADSILACERAAFSRITQSQD
jgi:hypothetical protein